MPKGIPKNGINKGWLKKGHKTWNKGKKDYLLGDKNPAWKGENVGYMALHSWVRRHLGEAHTCEKCGKQTDPTRVRNYIHWANKSGNYKRIKSDWVQLCVPCHRKKDGWNDLKIVNFRWNK